MEWRPPQLVHLRPAATRDLLLPRTHTICIAMSIHTTTRRICLTLLLLGATAMPALAYCPSVPDGPDTNNVDNGRQRALCMQGQLEYDASVQRNQVQFDSLKTTIDQMEVQRRFDRLPRPGQF